MTSRMPPETLHLAVDAATVAEVADDPTGLVKAVQHELEGLLAKRTPGWEYQFRLYRPGQDRPRRFRGIADQDFLFVLVPAPERHAT